MKFLVAIASLAVVVKAAMPEISADSALGQRLLSKARKLNNNNNNKQKNNADDYYVNQFAWVKGYSVKFQGCSHIMQWNDRAEENNDVRIATTRLVRFRLCPSSSCSANKAAGCNSGYGDYIIDMEEYLIAYYEAKQQATEYACQTHLQSKCNCGNDDAENCEYNCYTNAGMSECIENQNNFNMENYMQCAEYRVGNQNNNNNNKNNDNEVKYYIGPYCAEQGGQVYFGLFTDDSCTEYAQITFESIAGFELPYSKTSLVDLSCHSCIEPQNAENYNDQQDADQVAQFCEYVYREAGKCESKLPSGTVSSANNNACNYMDGIKIVRQNGIIDTGATRPSAVATAFIVIFTMAFAAMAFYVWYLRTRLGIKQNALL